MKAAIICDLLLSFLLWKCSVARKQYTLNILTLIGYSGNPPRDGKMCEAAQQMVLDEINSRDDILPMYHMTAFWGDEGPGSMFSARTAITYTRVFDSTPSSSNNSEIIQSPLMLGPTFTPGCKSLGSFAQHLNSVLLVPGCLGPAYTENRKIFPNLYRTRITTELNNYPMATFIAKTGGWRKIALYANADNPYNIAIAIHFLQVVVKTGLDLIWFEVSSGISRAIVDSLKQSGARILVTEIVDLPTFLNLLCYCYQAGMTGSKYVFINSFAVSINPTSLPDFAGDARCPRDVIVEQIKSCVYFGTVAMALENNGNTTLLQYDLPAFESRFADIIRQNRRPDFEDRHACYDRMLQAILALDKTEKLLSSQNLSLRDFRKEPKIVMQAVNKSLAESDFVGVRVGRLRYSSRLETDDETMYVASWNSARVELQGTFRIVRRPMSNVNDPEAYAIQEMIPPKWGTPNGKPPRDFYNLRLVSDDISSTGVRALASTAITLAAIKAVGGFVVLLLRRKSTQNLGRSKFGSQVFLVIGCIALDAGAATFAFNVREQGQILCNARPFLVVIGLSLLNVLIFLRLFFVRKVVFLKEKKDRRLRTNASSRSRGLDAIKSIKSLKSLKRAESNHGGHSPIAATPSWSTTASTPAPQGRPNFVLSGKQEAVVIAFTIFFVAINVAALALVAAIDPPRVIRTKGAERSIYDEMSDTLTEQIVDICTSSYQNYVIGALTGLHLLILITGCCFAYELKSCQWLETFDKAHRYSAINATTLFGATICVLFIVQSQATTQTIMAIATILYSVTSAGILFGPSFVKHFQTHPTSRD